LPAGAGVGGSRQRFVSYLRGVGSGFFEQGSEPECAALALNAFASNLAAHELDESLDRRQANASTTIFACGRIVDLLKNIEQPGQDIGGDADTCICKGET
jgi:hypothetical protein